MNLDLTPESKHLPASFCSHGPWQLLGASLLLPTRHQQQEKGPNHADAANTPGLSRKGLNQGKDKDELRLSVAFIIQPLIPLPAKITLW